MLSDYSNTAVACTYTRDVGSGQVKIDKDGRPRLHYTLGKEDAENIWKVHNCNLVVCYLPGKAATGIYIKAAVACTYTKSVIQD